MVVATNGTKFAAVKAQQEKQSDPSKLIFRRGKGN
jgi:hypothetical protein